MKYNLLAALSLTCVALTPMSAFAQDAIAASLSASFGTNAGSVEIEAGDLSGTITAPQSISVAGAAGNSAVASAVANAAASGAAAGATNVEDLTPMVDVSLSDGLYETNVAFVEVVDVEAIAAAAVAAQCDAGFDASASANLGFLGTIVLPVDVTCEDIE